MRMVRNRGVVGLLVVAVLVVVGMAVTTLQANAWYPVICGGDCINLMCIPPAPPSMACMQIGGGCGSVPWYPDCAHRDNFSPE